MVLFAVKHIRNPDMRHVAERVARLEIVGDQQRWAMIARHAIGDGNPFYAHRSIFLLWMRGGGLLNLERQLLRNICYKRRRSSLVLFLIATELQIASLQHCAERHDAAGLRGAYFVLPLPVLSHGNQPRLSDAPAPGRTVGGVKSLLLSLPFAELHDWHAVTRLVALFDPPRDLGIT